MLLTTTENIPGRQYEILGVVKGNMVQTKNIARDIGQGLKSMVGGELTTYTEMMNESRAIATKRMVEEAERMGRGRHRHDALLDVRGRGRSGGDHRLRHRSQVRPNLNMCLFRTPLPNQAPNCSQSAARRGRR